MIDRFVTRKNAWYSPDETKRDADLREENLREVVLFPMNQRAEDLMMGAPSEATPKQLRELHLRLNLPEKPS